MSVSSTRAVCSGSNVEQASNGVDKTQIAIQVPAHLTYNMDRFTKEGGERPVNGHLRSPIVFGHAQTQAEAEARMQVQLLEFDEKFGQNGSSGGDTRVN
ncbi:hypothetical protein GGI43DRAFT_404412, partial [Trichoderma evansii]